MLNKHGYTHVHAQATRHTQARTHAHTYRQIYNTYCFPRPLLYECVSVLRYKCDAGVVNVKSRGADIWHWDLSIQQRLSIYAWMSSCD
jgi:hypothetical protein